MGEKYKINFWWDSEVNVWIATSEDVLGLVLEDESLDFLVEKSKTAIKELLLLENKLPVDDIFLDYSISRLERVIING